MVIEKFYIKNFRSLHDFKVDKFGNTTVFYGDNNAGKSNILAALAYIFKRKPEYNPEIQQLTKPVNFYRGHLENFSNNFYKNQKENIKFDVTVNVKFVEFNKSLITLKRILQTSRTPKKYSLRIVGHITPSSDSTFPELITEFVEFNGVLIYTYDRKGVHYFPSLDPAKAKPSEYGALFADLMEPLNDSVVLLGRSRDMLECKFDGKDPGEITPINFKTKLHSLYLSESEYSTFETIQEMFRKPPFNFGEISFAQIGDDIEIMIKEKDIRLPINHIGSGVLQSLYILTYIIVNNAKIIALEELEQNLSPTRQEKTLQHIQSLLNNPDSNLNQILLSSHSYTYAKDGVADLIYLIDKKEYDTTIVSTMYDGMDIDEDFYAHFNFTPDGYSKEEFKQKFEEFKILTRRQENN